MNALQAFAAICFTVAAITIMMEPVLQYFNL